jgi:hypothetical protein
MSVLPDDPESTILKRLKKTKPEDQEPDAASDRRSELGSWQLAHAARSNGIH